jgi:Leucine-rich repeat (LRR) protein
MELYIGNNEIEDIAEIEYLKGLPRLIILDVSGNPFCNVDSYRLYTIYRIKKLKVLDGVGVSSNEVMNAKEKFCGKLTKEIIVDKVGHSFFEHIREIQLEGCKIKDVEILNSPEFKNLREINLDNNHMVDLSTLGDLPALSLLRLNHNRIESLRAASLSDKQNGAGKSRPASRALSASSLAAVADMHQAQADEERRSPSPADGVLMVNKFNLLNLEILHLGYNKITDIKELELHNFPNLRSLYLPGNDISRVDGLSSCTDLRELCLDKNRIRSLDPNSLVNLKMLRDLRIDENGLRSLSNFPLLPNLCILSVAGNRVNDIIELEKLCRVCDPKEISFSNNPVTRKQLYRTTVVNMFPNIRIIDGRDVGSEERERALHLMHNDRGSPLLGGGQAATAFMQQQAQQAVQAHAAMQQQQHDLMQQQNHTMRQHTHSRENMPQQGGGQRFEGGHRNSLVTNSAGHALLPYPKATVKLTAVNFETFAGHNSSHQILAPGSNQQHFSVPSAPNRNGDANRRTVWGGIVGDAGARGVRPQDFANMNGMNGNGGNGLNPGGGGGNGNSAVLAANYYMNVQNTVSQQQQQTRRSLERRGVAFPRKNSSIF